MRIKSGVANANTSKLTENYNIISEINEPLHLKITMDNAQFVTIFLISS